MKSIEEIRPGDEILTFDNGRVHPARAAKVWASGKKRILRITLSTGTVVECSEDHRFPTPAGDVFARDLRVNEGYQKKAHYAYGDARSIMYEAWERPREGERQSFTVGGEDRAWLLGMMIGDGSLSGSSVAVTAGAREDADVIAATFAAAFGARTTVYHQTRAGYVRAAFDTTPKPTPLTLWMDEIYGDRSWTVHTREKHLPERVVDLNLDERVALLRGLWDSDGTYAGSGQYFRSTSPRLIAQVGELLASLKIAYYVRDTAVFVQDRTRFTAMLGGPGLPMKRVVAARKVNAMPVLTGSLRAKLAGRVHASHGVAVKSLRLCTSGALTKVVPASDWTNRIPGFWDAYASSYEELYLGDTRPVFIERIEAVGEDECYDVQMEDQTSPYFIANGIATHNCYQEQVMQIARDVAGFSMGQADELRKVMGKKQKDKIPVYRQKFINGCLATNGIDSELAEQIFAFVEPFAGYGFNKSHAAAYGWIAYQTAYLKANFPLQYFSALMSSVRDKTDKLVEYIDEAKKMGIPVLPPDVNASLVDFAVVGAEIRFGLAAIKGVGENAVRSILATRESGGAFADLFDLVQRVDVKAVNRKVYEALIKCGALDTLPGNRAQQLDALDAALEVASREARDREMGQASLFGMIEEPHPSLKPSLRSLPAPSTMEQLAWEKETLGIFVSGHPLADVAEALARTGAVPVRDLRGLEDDSQVKVAGLVTAVRRTMTKAQAQMLIATIEDTTGAVECVVFPKQYGDLQARFVEDAIIVITGRLRLRERRGAVPGEEAPLDVNVSVNDVQPFDRGAVRVAPAAPSGWHVTVTSREQIDDLALLISEWSGTTPLVLHINGSIVQRAVASDRRVGERLVAIVGARNVEEGAP